MQTRYHTKQTNKQTEKQVNSLHQLMPDMQEKRTWLLLNFTTWLMNTSANSVWCVYNCCH